MTTELLGKEAHRLVDVVTDRADGAEVLVQLAHAHETAAGAATGDPEGGGFEWIRLLVTLAQRFPDASTGNILSALHIAIDEKRSAFGDRR